LREKREKQCTYTKPVYAKLIHTIIDFDLRIKLIPYTNNITEEAAQTQPRPSEAPVTNAHADIPALNKMDARMKNK